MVRKLQIPIIPVPSLCLASSRNGSEFLTLIFQILASACFCLLFLRGGGQLRSSSQPLKQQHPDDFLTFSSFIFILFVFILLAGV